MQLRSSRVLVTPGRGTAAAKSSSISKCAQVRRYNSRYSLRTRAGLKKRAASEDSSVPISRSTKLVKTRRPLAKRLESEASKSTKLARANISTPNTEGPRTCPVCVENRWSRQFAVVKRVPKCGHAISACKSCVLHHVTAELGRHGRLNKVSCLDCTNPLGHYYIKALLSKVDFRRMRALAAWKLLQTNPRFRYCVSSDCSAGQVHPKSKSTDMIICYSCETKSCFYHGLPWHEGYTCTRYDISHPDAPVLWTSEQRLKAQAKKCPGPGCKYFVEKVGGCGSMLCSMCGHSWRWDDVKFGVGVMLENGNENVLDN